ncbi:MAG: cyclic pyranopterin monophosphate synthase MoaC [bacterium]
MTRKLRSTHLDNAGVMRMVDVGGKGVTVREAAASARLRMRTDVLEAVAEGRTPKGDVFAAARVAGIQAAKRTSELIPLCHPLRIDKVMVDFKTEPDKGIIKVKAAVKASERTGVEMEALVAATVAALTVYDMCKGMQRDIIIEEIALERKTGGKATYRRKK